MKAVFAKVGPPLFYLLFPLLGVAALIIGIGHLTGRFSDRDLLDQKFPDGKEESKFEKNVAHHTVREWSEKEPFRFHQAPLLHEKSKNGELPPVEQRLPKNPLVIIPPEQTGPYGGNWNQFGTSPSDIEVMSTLSYETLIRWDPLLHDFLPNLAADWSIGEEARIFTFHLREGIRWSDGEPFTADDVLFWHEKVLLNKNLTPFLSKIFSRGGEVMKVEKLDRFTVRFSFKEPHGLFLQWIANPLFEEAVKFPKHYLKQFHPDFADPKLLETEARKRGFSSWHQLFRDLASWRNPEKPSLDAWILKQPPPAKQIIFERNPFYWKVDPKGNQLPYLDRVTFEILSPETMSLRFLRGDAGMQFRHVDPLRYPLFMEHRSEGNYRVLKWISSTGSGVLMPNLNHRDPVLKKLLNDRRFRIALSHAIDREEINETRYRSLGKPMQLGPTSTSPLFHEKYIEAHTAFDPKKADRLLDE